eukprot:CAMPEP_0118639682 /NCGR_PEP_ID=MMETSP0785-20121206/4352_1 /TAXON_ID=91992 /ORGANISM="Bolidomonas pacifica, Strain CCMP 1866" /LENGTH=412 /DNA_ID=CAMNT_0006531023 /DNA_START=198 /DNA_END=1433 /DNA_ORIENTATION=+
MSTNNNKNNNKYPNQRRARPSWLVDPSEYGIPDHLIKEKDESTVYQRFTPDGKKNSKRTQTPSVRTLSPTSSSSKSHIRLSKLMSTLGLTSRRECDAILSKGKKSKVRIIVNGVDVTGEGVGYKVPKGTKDVKVGRLKTKNIYNKPGKGEDLGDVMEHDMLQPVEVEGGYTDWESRRKETIVINKPLGYITGNMEPAPKRSTWTVKTGSDSRGMEFHAYKPLWSLITPSNYYDGLTSNPRPSDGMVRRMMTPDNGKGMAPAGRLDINSSGIVVYTRDGVVAKRLVGEGSMVEKEYVVTVRDFKGNGRITERVWTKKEGRKGKRGFGRFEREGRIWDKGKLPSLKPLLQSGIKLKGDGRYLKDVRGAEWLSRGRLRIVLREGRKRQVRRMVEEMLKMKVVELRRVRIGGVKIG